MTGESKVADGDLPRQLSKPAQRALAAAGYARLEHLAHVHEADLLALHGVGPKAIEQIRHALAARGPTFADPARGVRLPAGGCDVVRPAPTVAPGRTLDTPPETGDRKKTR